MGARRPTYAIAAGLLLSLLLHATLLIPALVGVMQSGTGPDALLARFNPDHFPEPEREEPESDDSIALGIDEGSPSTMTWIGYEDYEKHLAALAEVEQAAFKTSPSGADQPPQDSAAQPSPQVADEQAAADEAASPTPPTPDPLDQLQAWLKANTRGQGPDAEATNEKPAPSHEALDEALARLDEALNKPAEESRPQPADQPSQPMDPQPVNRDVGDVANKESDPTSTIDVPFNEIQIGKPLAAQGLEIRTRKPRFTSLVMLTAAPADPRVEIRFRRDGKPAKGTRILESSGDPRIDEAILNSLYRWRARGKRLQELDGRETIPIRLRIILTQRRR